MIDIQNLTFRYEGSDRNALSDITLSVPDKPFVPAIKIDGDLSDWEQDGVQTFAGINERIVEKNARHPEVVRMVCVFEKGVILLKKRFSPKTCVKD